jgi:hypothetical protein
MDHAHAHPCAEDVPPPSAAAARPGKV